MGNRLRACGCRWKPHRYYLGSADHNIMAVGGMMWVEKEPSIYQQEVDKDFMKDDFAEIEKAKCLATYVDGELVYKA